MLRRNSVTGVPHVRIALMQQLVQPLRVKRNLAAEDK